VGAADTNFQLEKFWCRDIISVCVGNFLHAVQPYICSETEFKKISAENSVVHRSDPWGMGGPLAAICREWELENNA
jgi:hypothetical protein